MAVFKTIQFLPEIFRTDTNQKFLNATADQLVSEPNLIKVNGYIGRKLAPSYKSTDSYITEPTKDRQDYQLEPSIVIKDTSTNNLLFATTYTDIINKISFYGGLTNNHNRLFDNEFYSYDPQIDLDKFVNYAQYYWLENGPDAVSVSTNNVPLQRTFIVNYDSVTKTYKFEGFNDVPNPTISLARGGTYLFVVNNPGNKFYIQTGAGALGIDTNVGNLSTRNVLGVTNNGTDVGTITFTVPSIDAQIEWSSMPTVDTVEYATSLSYKDVQGANPDELNLVFGGLDGPSTSLDGKKLIFINNEYVDNEFWSDTPIAVISGIVYADNYDMTIYDIDNSPFDPGELIPFGNRNDIFQISILPDILGINRIVLQSIVDIPTETKVRVISGTNNVGKEYYNRYNLLLEVPPVTSNLNQLFYQDDQADSAIGLIGLIDSNDSIIDVNLKIIGQKNYVSPNGILFTNGLKVSFDSTATYPYANNTFYVEGVGTAIKLILVTDLICPELDNDISNQDYLTINRSNLDLNGWTRSNRWFHVEVLEKTAEYNNTDLLINQNYRAQRPIIEFVENLQLFNFGITAKKPIDILDFTITNAFTQVQGVISASTTQFILTIGSNTITLTNGDRVVFAADENLEVRNKIYNFSIELTKETPVPAVYRAYIIETDDYEIETGNTVIVKKGVTGNKQWHFNGTTWIESQQKTTVNQAPKFDVINNDGISFSDQSVYPISDFSGTKVFSYKQGNGAVDQILGFALSYKNLNTQGDIQFENNFDSDSFTYNTNSGVGNAININSGFLQKNITLNTSIRTNTWIINSNFTKQYQTFTFTYDGTTNLFPIDILPDISTDLPNTKVVINKTLLNNSKFVITQVVDKLTILIDPSLLTVGDVVFVSIFNSQDKSNLGFYQIPQNFDNNSLNNNLETLTLGQMRNHLIESSSNSLNIVGTVPGKSNLRDITFLNKGGSILQHSAPVIYSGLFLNHPTMNFVNSIQLASKEYTQFKTKFLELAVNLNLNRNNVAESVDIIMASINSVKNDSFPWHYSDMVPYGDADKIVLPSYQIFDTDIRAYEITNIFNDNVVSNKAVYVYLTRELEGETITSLLVKGQDYYFDQTRPAVIIQYSFNLLYNDILTVVEYNSTDGSYVPETPTKLGLHPKFSPAKFLDNTYRTPIFVIQGHDGSITPAFNDFRDDFLLELEKRIYNNCKIFYNPINFNINDVVPGKWRSVDYSLQEFNEVLTQNFLRWAGTNRVNYTTNTVFSASDGFTWNYKKFRDTINGESLPGTWRSIFRYFFDTDRPHTHPWEMLGFSEKPDYWNDRYGPAPYTGGNFILWNDLEIGYIHSGTRAGIDFRYSRPRVLDENGEVLRRGLTDIIPVDDNGNLRNPSEFLVTDFDSANANVSFSVGDIGPTELAWRRSSDFVFALQQALALLKPAKYFSLLLDLENYFRSSTTSQFICLENNLHLQPAFIKVNGYIDTNGNVERSAGYINWIRDYIQNLGIANSGELVKNNLSAISVQLSYKMAGFSDKKFIELLAEQLSPSSINDSVIVPEENYSIELYKSSPINVITYSAVIVERTQNGYTVIGYNTNKPYFSIIPSLPNNNAYTIQTSGQRATIYKDARNTRTNIPYGYEFSTKQQLVDFLVGYQRFLQSQGFVFIDRDNQLAQTKDWILSAREFLHWSAQGWTPGNILVLSPTGNTFKVVNKSATVDEITNTFNSGRVIDLNYEVIKKNNFTVTRDDGVFTFKTFNDQIIGLAELNLVQYEHLLLLDNTTAFNDIIYVSETGNRQYRLRLVGAKTGLWNGSLELPGYIYSNKNVDAWRPGQDYLKGAIVSHKFRFYTALENISASDQFQTSSWKQIEQSELKSGIVNNLATNASDSLRYYDINDQPLNEKIQLFSNGLIGFRPRPYFTNLGIDVTTQSKFYQGLVKQGGTANAINALKGAQFNNLNTELNFFENWAFRVGEYGALDINRFVEFILPDGQFENNPAIFQLVDNTIQSQPDILSFSSADVYKANGNFTPNFLRSQSRAEPAELKPLPTAGFVNRDDVNATVFSLSDFDSFNSFIDDIGVGYTIWVAKDYDNQWNVFRATNVPGIAYILRYNIDDRAELIISAEHGLSESDTIILKNFDSRYNGVYRVYSVIDSNRVLISIVNNLQQLIESSAVISNGLVYKLRSSKLTTPIDVVNSAPYDGWLENDKIWVEYLDNQGNWGVYNRSHPWEFQNKLLLGQGQYTGNDHFGKSVAMDANALYMYGGAPDSSSGKVSVYAKNIITDNWDELGFLAPNNNNVDSFGQKIVNATVGNSNFVAVGAPDTLGKKGVVFIYENQVLIQVLCGNSPNNDDKFGDSLAISDNAQYLYIGAPGANTVFCYALNYPRENTSQIITGDGSTTSFTIYKQVASTTDILVLNVVGVSEYLPNIDYSITSYTSGVNTFTYTGTPLATATNREHPNLAATGGTGTGAKFNVTFRQTGPGEQELFEIGKIYKIATVGTTNFTLIGAASNTVGVVFTATNIVAGLTVPLSSGSSYTTGTAHGVFVTLSNAGQGYTVYDTLTISGSLFTGSPAGSSPANDITANVFAIANGTNLSFTTAPLINRDISLLQRENRYTFLDTLPLASESIAGSQFGSSLVCNSDGSTISVGAENTSVNGIVNSGAVYVYHRTVNEFVTNGSSNIFILPDNLGFVYRVYLNNALIYDLNSLGGYNPTGIVASYFVVGTNTIQYGGFGIPTLPQGNIIKVESNQFVLDQILYQQSTGITGSNFGRAIAMCNSGCNIYVSSPNYLEPNYRFGLVTRFLNVGRVYGQITGERNFGEINVDDILVGRSYLITNTGNTDFISIGASPSAVVVGSISGTTLTVTSITSGLVNLDTYISAAGLLPLTEILTQLTATNAASATTTANGSTGDNFFTVASLSGIVIGQFVSGFNIPSNSYVQIIDAATLTITITNQLLGNLTATTVDFHVKGNTGTYSVSVSQSLSSTTISLQPVPGINFKATGIGSGTGSVVGAVFIGESIFINNRQITFVGATLDSVVSTINGSNVPGVTASIIDNKINISSDVLVAANKLNIVSGNSGSPLEDLGIKLQIYVQSLLHPENIGETFGTALQVDQQNETLVVASDGADIEITLIFDSLASLSTIFDSGGTKFVDVIRDSGAVYIFNLMPNPYEDVNNPKLYAYTQKLIGPELATGFNFGSSVDIKANYLMVGVANDYGIVTDGGSLYYYLNESLESGWNLIRYNTPRVDIGAVKSAFIYNAVSQNILEFFDYLDPVKGKLLGIVDQELDYKEEYDPASYNRSSRNDTINNNNFYWADRQVGKTWWDLTTVRFIDYEQDILQYRAKNWGALFPNSEVTIYEWVESDFLPGQYVDSVGDGVPKYIDNSAYTSVTIVDPITGIISQKYYYWVANKTSVNVNIARRTLSVKALQNYITNPKDQGIPYLGLLSTNAIAMYNITDKLVDSDVVIHIDNPTDRNINLIHNEWQLVQQNSLVSNVPLRAIFKLKDSLIGVDTYGNIVPDPNLRVQDRLGILNNPRQSMVINRLSILEEYVTVVNNLLNKYPILLITYPSRLYLNETLPTVGYDTQTDSVEDLNYLDTSAFANGYKILVPSDSNFQGRWTIYNYNSINDSFELFRIQSYQTNLFWTAKVWYDTSYQNGKEINYTVNIYSDIQALSPEVGDYIKILDNGQNKWLLYEVLGDASLNLIGAEEGTLELSTDIYDISSGSGYDTAVFDSVGIDPQPVIEFQNIYDSVYYEIFAGYLSPEFDELFFTIINQIFAEQKTPDWIFKTSFIDVFHKLRTLEQFPSYIRDNQSFYNDYIQEVKPYRTQVREYVPSYFKEDYAYGNWTDFDVPSAYDNRYGTFRSPDINLSSDAELFLADPYSDYANNYKFKVVDFILGNIGLNYSLPPNVEITGGGGSGASAVTTLFGNGRVQGVTVINSGSGYTSTPNVFINGGGVGATAYPMLKNEFYSLQSNLSYNLIRSIDTSIKLDRLAYTSNLILWQPNTAYANTVVVSGNTSTDSGNVYITSGNIIVYNNQSYLATNANVTTEAIFDFTRFSQIDSGNVLLNAIDRIVSYYQPTVGMTGKNLNELVYGLEYPGTSIIGPEYRSNTFTVTSNIISFSYEGLTINSANIAVVDFIKLGFDLNKTIRIEANVPFAFQNNGIFSIVGVERDAMILTGEPIETTYRLTLSTEVTAYAGDFITQTNTIANAYVLQNVINSRFLDIIYTVPEFTVSANIISINGTSTGANVGNIYTGGNVDATITYIDQNLIVDSNIYSTYLDTELGTRPQDINILGGAYIDSYSSHAPEELIPGRLYDALEIKVFSNTVGNTATYGFRVFQPMSSNILYARISANSTTTLSSNLSMTDDEILVNNAAVLPTPSPSLGNPGVVFINGEKIHYYQKYDSAKIATAIPWIANTDIAADTLISFGGNTYLTSGNVYANANIYVNTSNLTLITLNSLRQIRRGVDGTGISNVIVLGNIVSDGSQAQLIPNAQIFAAQIFTGNVNATANVTFKLLLTSNISANLGDYITQFVGNTGNARVLDNVTNSNLIPINFVTGTFQFASNTGTRINVASLTTGITNTTANVISFTELGAVNANGNVVLTSTNVLRSNIWEQFSTTLENSSTVGAQFIRAEPSYTP